MISYKNLKCI